MADHNNIVVGEAVPIAADRGIEWTNGIGGLFVRQIFEPLEAFTGLETKNKYKIVALDSASLPAKPDPDSMKPYREMASHTPLLNAREQSKCCERICCPLFRGLDMDFTDGAQNTFFKVHRPFECDPCYCRPLCGCTTQKLFMNDKNNVLVAKAEEKGGCCTSCCTREFILTDPAGKEMYTLEASSCQTSTGGCNFCAPSCFNPSYEVVLMENGKPVADYSQWVVWPGCNCSGLTDRTNMLVKFPPEAPPEKRVGIVAGMFLVEYAVNELRRQNNDGGGGGGGGAAPSAAEMER